MEHDARPRWYVIHCEPHHDRQVERLVGQAGQGDGFPAELDAAGDVPEGRIEVFAPRITCTRKRNGDKPLFPGYVFARLNLQDGIWARARNLPGVRGLVHIGGEPCPVDDGVIEVIRRRTADYAPRRLSLKEGERVRVTAGSFADLEGIFCEALSGDERIAILIDMMRREVRVELSIDEVERVVRGVAA